MQRALIAGLAATMLAACSADAREAADADVAAISPGSVLEIGPEALAARIEAGEAIQLIDVRSPEEFAEGHLEGAINIPLDSFDPATLPDPAGAERVLYCRSDRRSGLAADRLAQSGADAVHMDGGILAWIDAGLPTAE